MLFCQKSIKRHLMIYAEWQSHSTNKWHQYDVIFFSLKQVTLIAEKLSYTEEFGADGSLWVVLKRIPHLFLYFWKDRLWFSEDSRKACNCVYGSYNGCSCPRHDDHSDILYLSSPNSQITFMDFGGFINATKVTDDNLHPCSSSDVLCCAVSASLPVFPTCFHLFSASYPDIWTLVQFQSSKSICDFWNLWNGLNILMLFLQSSVSIKLL